ncbi:two-component sensor histidine kinase [Methylobacterium oxalidis]|uniref:C4-dicarboxylate transport sensor protein DctB n=2 Tax=Methylobacterium oxalidis TaxID=944322 RepID=A0A512J3K7_9HYPH|nr:two-component sensor histidine kinase [Methylobacterium oxalidis]GJE34636.1 C4-dicarboxylate transport sensor protein DctB [Methylobacterium oxalidis]GLS62811.1 two-component sensor histidine kinase [Methylobacterium oxalidis]
MASSFSRGGRWLWLAALAAMLAAAWAGGRAAERSALADLGAAAHATLALQVGALRAEMQRQTALPLALAADPEIAGVLRAGADEALVARVNGRLAEVAAATGAAVIYAVRADGITVAASNVGTPRSFLGQDYGFRPYFRSAMAQGAGSQFALGTVSGRPGFYLARRLGDASGVVVVKIEFDAVEAGWREAEESVFVADARGIVLVASDPAWRFRTLRPIGPAERDRIRESLDFGGAPLDPLPLHPVEGQEGLVRVGGGPLPARAALLRDAAVPGTEWRLYTLTPVGAAVEREWRQGAIIALLATGLAALGLATLLGRRARTRARLREEAARREELEARVAERTQALSEANGRLRAEAEERRRAEAERERLGRELAQAGRLAALGQFAASMAHEINQPLAAIRSYADNTAILVRRGRVEDAAENVTAIGRLTDRIGALTRQLKGFARRASGRREPVALAEIVRNSLELVEGRAAASGIALDVARPPAGLAVLGDGPRLEQVLVNLIQNALDAVAGRAEPRVAVVILEEEARIAVEVRDNGTGIEEAQRAQVFDAFFTTKSDGLGLGLAIARGIVEDCGGTLTLRGNEPAGTIFRMELARAPALERRAESAA